MEQQGNRKRPGGKGRRRRQGRRRRGGSKPDLPQGNAGEPKVEWKLEGVGHQRLRQESGTSGGRSRRSSKAFRRRPRRPQDGAGRRTEPQRRPEGDPSLEVRGVLQIASEGNGFLRSHENDYNPSPEDPFIPRQLIQERSLEAGLEIEALAIPGNRRHQAPWVDSIQKVNGDDPGAWARRTPFKDLVAEAPSERIRLETRPEEVTTRVVDLITPIGKGQRCLIVAPPKAGKTVLLQKMAAAISTNHPDVHLIVLLVDERPEEVTDMRRSVNGEVVASSSDELARNHVQVAEVVLERAKRLVESRRDVVILLDSITRLSRAYNTEQRGSGRVLSGGIDARTMEKPRRFFGAARKAEGGGSLTVIGTALVDTGSRMDEVIFQEFKGTGNTEIVMDRDLFDRRIFPAIDISQSGTRKEELLYTSQEYQKVTLLRRALAPLKSAEAMQLLIGRLSESRTNADFLASMVS